MRHTWAAAVAAALLLFFPPSSMASMAWKPAPVTASHDHGRPAFQSFELSEPDGAEVKIVKSDLTGAPLGLHHGMVEVKPFGMDFYHALLAEKRTAISYESAIRYITLMGKSSGHSPSELVALRKAEFEIVPHPQPREHARYTAGDRTAFIVRLDGKPVARAAVRLSTSNGTSVSAVTGPDGSAGFIVPDDFKGIEPGHRKNPPAEMTVESQWLAGEQAYFATLTAPYHVNPGNWQSFPLGLLFAALGAAAGGWMTLGGKEKRTMNGEEDGAA